MKRLVSIALLAAVLTVLPGFAHAVEIKVSGHWELGMGWVDNSSFTSAKTGGSDDIFSAQQMFRPQVRFITSDTLEAVLGLEIGIMGWGSGNDDEDFGGGGLDADGKIVKIKNAYLQWSPLEKLQLRMGVQSVALPSAAFGNPILDADVAGVLANYRFSDTATFNAFWLRPFDAGFSAEEKQHNDEMDMFGLTFDFKGEGFSVNPWAMYARNGNQSGYWDYRSGMSMGEYDISDSIAFRGSSNLWWVGGAFEVDMFDPFTLKLDAMYGAAKGGNAPEFSGWLVAGLFEYETESKWGNPGILGWYASGDKGSDYKKGRNGKFGRMPIIGNENGGFAPAAFGYPGSFAELTDSLLSSSGVGSWGVGLQLDGMSFVEKLSHTLRVAYVRGTNDQGMIKNGNNERYGVPYNIMGDNVYMTKKDYAIEADFLTTWDVTENLNIYLETGMVHLNLDPGVWQANANTTNAWKAQIIFEYTF